MSQFYQQPPAYGAHQPGPHHPMQMRGRAYGNVGASPMQQPYRGGHGGLSGAGLSGRHQHLKRQVSQLRSQYALIKWCAVYVNAGSSPAQSGGAGAMDFSALSQPIPKTETRLDMSLEQTIIAEVASLAEHDKQMQSDIERRRRAGSEKERAIEKEKMEKLSTLQSITGLHDRDRAIMFLEKYEWDLEKATEAVFASRSTADIMSGRGSGQPGANGHHSNPPPAYGGGGGGGSNSALLQISIPDGRSFSFNMNGSDTFWGVYGRVIESAPDLSSRNFTFVLTSGHRLAESEFDRSLKDAGCVPQGMITISY